MFLAGFWNTGKACKGRQTILAYKRALSFTSFELIDSYNAGSKNIIDIFRELIALFNILTEEQARHVREHLSEKELTIFDILTRPAPELTVEEREKVKKVARDLLERLRQLLCRVPPDSEHWISESEMAIDRLGNSREEKQWPNRVGGPRRSATRL